MSQVLVSQPANPALAATMIHIGEAVEHPISQLHLNALNFTGDCEVGLASAEEKRMASQLAYLASQHHTSEYNRLKFGPGGAPMMYIPLSIQLPAQVREMKAKQTQDADKRTWWPAEQVEQSAEGYFRAPVDLHTVPDCPLEPPQLGDTVACTQVVNTPESDIDHLPVNFCKPVPPLNHPPALNLRRELSVAMSSPLPINAIPHLSSRDPSQQPNLSTHAKTSESHPINISPIIPLELLPLITSHLVPARRRTYMFDLPPSLFLDHVTIHASHVPSDATRTYPIIHPSTRALWNEPNGTGPPPPPSLFPAIWQKSFLDVVSEPLVTVDGAPLEPIGCSPSHSDPFHPHPQASVRPNIAPTLSQTSSVNSAASHSSSLLLPTVQNRPHSAPPSLVSPLNDTPEIFVNGSVGPTLLPELMHAMSSDILHNGGTKCLETPDVISRNTNVPHPTQWTHTPCSPPVPALPTLGNMLLSSCPGKKVRLSGPVKGRGAICRDLGHDLRRVRALGVGCVICCLDDEELEFLGASWSKYSEVARQVGLDVLRIPIPEGLAPTTPSLLDEHLSQVIHSYTLKGVPILVHCRGGVGRAGLIACCWMLKLGLCGWLPPPTTERNSRASQGHGNEIVKVRKETVELVERAIAVVRRRRSVKAIETYEQVRFLVEFVEHLQMRGGGVSL